MKESILRDHKADYKELRNLVRRYRAAEEEGLIPPLNEIGRDREEMGEEEVVTTQPVTTRRTNPGTAKRSAPAPPDVPPGYDPSL